MRQIAILLPIFNKRIGIAKTEEPFQKGKVLISFMIEMKEWQMKKHQNDDRSTVAKIVSYNLQYSMRGQQDEKQRKSSILS